MLHLLACVQGNTRHCGLGDTVCKGEREQRIQLEQKTDERATLTQRRYTIKLDSDEVQYGGHGRLDHNTEFFTEPIPYNDRPNSMLVYIPCRTAVVLANEEIDYCY
ncbi:1,4-alpha-glucan-branching enzyme [Bagarius yarrelli]|uniref:1,4-alpha-glucan-branching enzyme n=1 Tax=Bagarius yarrelli TaxID=175774 RepID=A0A556U7F0_BAGYA|nr:1,4-alpha-glucan-branching enzyme [Bagarius yarrelli]